MPQAQDLALRQQGCWCCCRCCCCSWAEGRVLFVKRSTVPSNSCSSICNSTDSFDFHLVRRGGFGRVPDGSTWTHLAECSLTVVVVPLAGNSSAPALHMCYSSTSHC
ncbi:unnamed protein product [Polarella glacialis]|uniref:Uncharacterized protein n=1 Tax=Polarella glacialis TaxID=89957 RepID=A0A813DTN3_POLGL|nr:unnamed protein product [Polarella glacialis]